MFNIFGHAGNANPNHNEIPTTLYPLGWLESKRQVINAGGEREKLELSYIAAGNVKWCSRFGKQFGSSSKANHIPADTYIHLMFLITAGRQMWLEQSE